MHHHTELSFVDEFRWVSSLHYLKNGWQNAVLRWCMLQAGPPLLRYYCAVVLHSCILLPHVGHSSNHEYHFCQLTRQSSGVLNFYRTFKFFIWLSLVFQMTSFTLQNWIQNMLVGQWLDYGMDDRGIGIRIPTNSILRTDCRPHSSPYPMSAWSYFFSGGEETGCEVGHSRPNCCRG